ncbi:MAG: competence/damage-inducible protein A [Phycisphaerae bacterium]|nr:competence/damage-inducible protein A [Phycisphaerae bacterium]
MIAVILSVGDELVLGQTVDTNSAWMSGQLASAGFAVSAHQTVADDQAAIESAIRHWTTAQPCDLLIISGGIGPTEDDLTRQSVAGVLQQPLELNAMWLDRLKAFWASRGRPMPAINEIQARIPVGAALLDNPVGTAAGIGAMIGHTQVFALPGVPKEMKAMFALHVLPWVQQHSGGAAIVSRTLHTFGLGESAVAEKLGLLMQRNRNPSVGTTVSNGIVSLRINSRFSSVAETTHQADATALACRSVLGALIFGEEWQTLQEVVGLLLLGARATVATAESCTGGLLAKQLTDIAGSSSYFKEGFVTYSNEAKARQLGVPAELIEKQGAVSKPVAIAMAEGALRIAAVDYAMAITGIAGPGGGTVDKPVGTVWIALASSKETTARLFNFPGDREAIRERSARTALAMLRAILTDQPTPF